MAHLDHIVILVPYASLADPPAWISKNFTVTPGGQHADQKTENRLICFRDGSYIELIAFVNDDPKNREGHGWGDSQFGIIDFAFTNSTGDAFVLFSELQERLDGVKWEEGDVRVEYKPPHTGGRKRPDGIDVKWTVTWPVVSTGYQRGELPFFCHDVTARSVRVPVSEEATTHPSGVYGIKQLTLFVPETRVRPLSRAYAAISGVSDSSTEVSCGSFHLKRLAKVEGTEDAHFNLQAPTAEWQVDSMRERDGVFLGSLDFGGQISSDGTESFSRIDDGKGGMGKIYVDLERLALGS
ncbi:glyoxalase-like domain-containing protein [Rhexocercosporidium sp. MPI-PUGE-AT-0058]|nr:glyoxalase-like domain-containing protein [Rhexocercosporidium sp. MPI-PUGE-AT-0058]